MTSNDVRYLITLVNSRHVVYCMLCKVIIAKSMPKWAILNYAVLLLSRNALFWATLYRGLKLWQNFWTRSIFAAAMGEAEVLPWTATGWWLGIFCRTWLTWLTVLCPLEGVRSIPPSLYIVLQECKRYNLTDCTYNTMSHLVLKNIFGSFVWANCVYCVRVF